MKHPVIKLRCRVYISAFFFHQEDVDLLMFGFGGVILFVMFQLGRSNSVQQRAALSVTGVSCIVMGLISAYGKVQGGPELAPPPPPRENPPFTLLFVGFLYLRINSH